MDNTDFNYIEIADELGAATDNYLGKRAEQEMILIEDEDVDFECDYDCEGCWFVPESCGKLQLEPSPPKLTIISDDQQRIDDIKELAFLYDEYARAADEDLTEDGKEIKATIWKLLRPWEYEEQEK